MKIEQRPGAARPPSPEQLLAEFEDLLRSSGRLPDVSASSAPAASAATAPTSADVGAEDEDAVASVAGGGHRDPMGEAPRLRSRRWRLPALALASGLAVAAALSLALLPSARVPKSPLSEDLARRPVAVEPPAAPVPSNNVARSPAREAARPDPAQNGAATGDDGAGRVTAKTPAPLEAQRPAEGANAPTPAPTATAAAPVPQAPTPEPPEGGLARPDLAPKVAPGAATAARSTDSPTPTPTPRPHDKAATAAERGPASSRPAPDTASAKKIAAQNAKAKEAAAAKPPHPPLRPPRPDKAAAPPVEQAATQPAAQAPPPLAAPVGPAAFATQSVGQLNSALGYLSHLPAALIGRATGSNAEAR